MKTSMLPLSRSILYRITSDPLHLPLLGCLEHPWDDGIWHNAAIFLPMCSIFVAASTLVPSRSVREQNAHVNEVGPWKEIVEATGRTERGTLQTC